MSGPVARSAKSKIADEQERAFRMKLAGLTHDRIAAELGVSVGTVCNRLAAAIHDHVGPVADDYVAHREAELNDLYARAYRLVADAGKSDDVRLKAIARCQMINESRRKLRGADAPEALEVSMEARADLTVTAITAVIERLQLPSEKKAYALEAAAAALDGGPMPELPVEQAPEQITETSPGAPVIMSAEGKTFVIVKGQRFEYAGPAPMPDPIMDAEVVAEYEEATDADLTGEQEQGDSAPSTQASDAGDEQPARSTRAPDVHAQQQAGVWTASERPRRASTHRRAIT